jgi:hypothetical protein
MHQPLLIVDAGNLLFVKALGVEGGATNTISLITAHGLVRAYNAMLYDAVAVSASDLSAGADFFRETMNELFPWVAANVYDTNNNLLFPPHIIKQLESVTIGIIGLTGNNGHSIAGCIIGDWRESLQKEIALLNNRCDILVVLSNLSESENREIQRDFNQVDIIVAADRKRGNIQPRAEQNCLLVQSGNRGKYLGKLDVIWNGRGKWLAESPGKGKAGVGRQPENRYRASSLLIKPAPSQDSVDGIVQEIKDSISAYNRYRSAVLQPADPAVQFALQQNAIEGFTACTSCHKKQTLFWKDTKHASAYATLTEQGQSFNLQCLPCHVTAGRVNASSPESERLYLLYLSADRQTVGCEVCHGPGKHHILSPGGNAPVRLPAVAVCTQCHTSARDSNFIYQKKMAAIACPAD